MRKRIFALLLTMVLCFALASCAAEPEVYCGHEQYQPLLEALPRGKYPLVDQVLEAFSLFETLDEKYVPADSLLREFIGGSTYHGN